MTEDRTRGEGASEISDGAVRQSVAALLAPCTIQRPFFPGLKGPLTSVTCAFKP
jgi:hypothetical protein